MNQVKSIYDLEGSTAREILDLAVGSICLSSGKRADDVYEFLSNEYRVIPCDSKNPRRHRWIQLTSKADPEGKGPESDRTTVIFCICLEALSGEEKDLFVAQLTLNPFCKCAVPCPFDHIANYTRIIPDCFGKERDDEIKALGNVKTDLKPLHFIRALTARGNVRTMTKNTMGNLNIFTKFDSD